MPGFSTRYISQKREGLAGMSHGTASLAKIASNVASAKGSASETSHLSKRTFCSIPALEANWFAVRIPQIIDIHTKNMTAIFLRDMSGVSAGSAADFQYRRIAGECKRSWNLFGLLGSDPACLAEIFFVCLDSSYRHLHRSFRKRRHRVRHGRAYRAPAPALGIGASVAGG